MATARNTVEQHSSTDPTTDTPDTPTPKIAPDERFRRTASVRTTAAITAIRKLEGAAGKGYEHTPEQTAKIVGALRASVERLENVLNGRVTANREFEL